MPHKKLAGKVWGTTVMITAVAEDGKVREMKHVADEFQRMRTALGDELFAKLLRRYLKAYVRRSKGMHYCTPVFAGLLAVKHRDTFIKYYTVLFQYMWT